MTDKILPGSILVFLLILAVHTEAQDDTAAASGMTSGLPGVSAAKQAELMYIRAQAQKARPEAEAAAMARTAEDALDKKMTDRTLQDARETKELKQQAAYNYQLKKAADAYKGVSQSEINAWGDGTGAVKVQRGVPAQFTASLPPEEEPEKKKGRFGLLKAPTKAAKGAASATVGGVKKAFSWRPFGKKKNEETIEPPAPSPEPAPYNPPTTVTTDSLALDDTGEEKKGFMSRIPFVGGKKKKQVEVAYQEPPAVGNSPELAATTSVEADYSVGEEEKKKGFMGRMFGGKKDDDYVAPPPVASTGGSPFGPSSNPTIDASLFPDSDDSDEELMAQDLSSQKRKLLKMPKLSAAKIPKIKVPNPVPEEPKPSLPKVDRSGAHSGGSKTYVVSTPNARFMRFGESALNSETNSGQVVEMTKAGDEWSSVRLSNGVTGIMQNKDLRPAGAGEAASSPPSPSPGFATTSP